ncbi:Stf0 family sulfotransferase [Lusitaniella coriacea]|uniref:Stf0 family sulfotransferase n=1 Tax=Lusitaniella coriacea TaxID=1983105 RepID=UPI003CE862A5
MKIKPQIIRKLRRLNIVLADTVCEKNLIQKHRNYQEFIILCRSRTGSNFLVNLLQSHEQIRASGEIFTGQKRMDWGYPISIPEESLSLRETDPLEFIARVIFRETSKSVLAVGFKLFYYQAKKGKQESIWTYLQNKKKLKIIHLTRKNILKTHLSRQLAKTTKTWVNTKMQDTSGEVKSIFLDYEGCLQAFQDTKRMKKQYREFFSEHSILEVVYEELVKNQEEETKRIQDFLGVKNKILYASTEKQSKQPLSQTISNYEELKEKFSNTAWSSFF